MIQALLLWFVCLSGVSTQVRLSGIGAIAEIGGETYISRVKIGCMKAAYAVIV